MNIKEIAQIAGVSVSTVSKVMNNKDSAISQETRDKVLKIAKEYNYTPYASIMTANIKTFQIGVLFYSMQTAHSTLAGILSEASSMGYSVTVAVSDGDSREELKAISGFQKNNVDVILCETTDKENNCCSEQLQKSGIPYIIFNSSMPDSLAIDFGNIGYHAAQTLINKGHRDIACILFPGTRTAGFFDGFKKCLFDHQIPLNQELVYQEINSTLFYKIAAHTISAIVCSHFSSALQFYEQCSRLHYRTPYDISLISLRDDGCFTKASPPISTYTIPYFQFGTFLCRKAIHLAEEQKTDNETFLPDVELDNEFTIGIPFVQRTRKITVVGSINIDNYLNVKQLPTSGKTVRTSVSSLYPGGKGTNQAIGAAKLGHHVALLGNVGSDMDSNIIYDALEEYSVDTSGLKRCLGLPTGKAYIIVEPGGDSLISILSGASEALYPEDLRERERIFENTGYTLISTEVPMTTVVEACLLTKKHGGRTVLKPSACSHLPEELLKATDILIPNLNEINELAPKASNLSEKAGFFLNYGIEVVIITLGSDGCFLKTPTCEKYYPAINFNALDNTGACDAFISAFASYMLYGYDLDRAVRIAAYAGAFSVTREGVVPALIDKKTLESYIRREEPGLLNQG